MAACTNVHTTPWQQVRGDEVGFRVVGLGPDEELLIEFFGRPDHIEINFDGEYAVRMPTGVERYRCSKTLASAGPEYYPTTVEILCEMEVKP